MKAPARRLEVESSSGKKLDVNLDRWSTKITDRCRKTVFAVRKSEDDEHSILLIGTKRLIVPADRDQQELPERSLEVRSTGDINVKAIDGEADLQSSKGSVRVGSMKGRLKASAPRGSVIVKELLGSASLRSGRGDVKLKKVYSETGAKRVFDIEAARGNVVIRVITPASLTIEIDLIQTRRNWFPFKIISDFALNRREDREGRGVSGRPARHLEAKGVVGNGESRLRVQAVDCNVYLRSA